jgi:hypothetical protein
MKPGAVLNASSGVPPAFAQLDSRRGGEATSSNRDADLHVPAQASKDQDRLRRLEHEVAHLKAQLIRQAASSFDGSTIAATNSPSTQKDEAGDLPHHEQDMLANYPDDGPATGDNPELRFFRGKEFRTRYYGPHNASMAFTEVSGQFSIFNKLIEPTVSGIMLTISRSSTAYVHS